MIEITPTAINKIKQLNEEDELQSFMKSETQLPMRRALRVAVRPGGCSGFSYDLFFDKNIFEDRDEIDEFDGVLVVMDSESSEKLRGATLDYQEGLQGAGFKFINPNATRTCGCGESFS